MGSKKVALPIRCVLSSPSPIYKVRPRTVKDEDDAEGGAPEADRLEWLAAREKRKGC